MRHLVPPLLLTSLFVPPVGSMLRKSAWRWTRPPRRRPPRPSNGSQDQQNADGSFSDGGYAHNTAITAFAMLAFMSQGHLPNQGQYGPEVAKAARFLIAVAARDDGYLIGARGGNMYCHAMATLALAELWGQTGDDALKPVVEKAVDLIVRSQNSERRLALRAAADRRRHLRHDHAGDGPARRQERAACTSPTRRMKKAIAYIKSCYARSIGGFTYSPAAAHPASPAPPPACASCSSPANTKPRRSPKAVEYLKTQLQQPAPLLLRPLLRRPRHAPGRRQGLGRLVRPARASTSYLRSQAADGSWSHDQPPRSRPGLPDEHRRHRPVGAGALPADLPALRAARWDGSPAQERQSTKSEVRSAFGMRLWNVAR